jgi:hypothetical protein
MTDTRPALTGSAKQIIWATDIRAAALKHLDEQVRAPMAAWVANHPEDAPREVINNHALDQAISNHPDSRWWIDQHQTLQTMGNQNIPSAIAASLRVEAGSLTGER